MGPLRGDGGSGADDRGTVVHFDRRGSEDRSVGASGGSAASNCAGDAEHPSSGGPWRFCLRAGNPGQGGRRGVGRKRKRRLVFASPARLSGSFETSRGLPAEAPFVVRQILPLEQPLAAHGDQTPDKCLPKQFADKGSDFFRVSRIARPASEPGANTPMQFALRPVPITVPQFAEKKRNQLHGLFVRAIFVALFPGFGERRIGRARLAGACVVQ